jgi:hypothetical protein
LGDLDHLNAPSASVYLDRMKLTSALNSKAAATSIIQARTNDPSASEVVAIAMRNGKEAKLLICELQKRRGLQKLKVSDRVLGPTIGTDVIGIYQQLCFESHNDLIALQSRHHSDDGHLQIGDTVDLTTALQTVGYATLLVTLAFATLNSFARSLDVRYFVTLRSSWP